MKQQSLFSTQYVLGAFAMLAIAGGLFWACTKANSTASPADQPLLQQVNAASDANNGNKLVYDKQQRLTEISSNNLKTVYSYEKAELSMELFEAGSAQPYGSYNGQLDEKGRLVALSGMQQTAGSVYVASYKMEYDSLGQLTKMRISYKYDNDTWQDRVLEHTWADGNCVRTVQNDNGERTKSIEYRFDKGRQNHLRLNSLDFIEQTDDKLLGVVNRNPFVEYTVQNALGTTIGNVKLDFAYTATGLPTQCAYSSGINGEHYTETYSF